VEDVELLKGGLKDEPRPPGREYSQKRTPRREIRKSETDNRIREILWEHPRGLTVDELGRELPLNRSLQRKMEFTRDYADLGIKTPSWEDAAGAVGRGVAAIDTGQLRVDLHLPALEIYADPLFERVVSNLVDNTLRHGEHATSIRFGAMREGVSCILTIEDDGAGVPPEKKESIFRPGYGRHTGFGLILIREILGITGMSIRENGEPGRGARFEIRIPRGGFQFREGGGVHGDACVRA